MIDNIRLPFVYELSIAVAGGAFIVLLFVSLEAGFRIGLARRKRIADAEGGGGGVVLNSMFALLGLILAFTYGSSVNRYLQRKQHVVNEANARGTAYLRAGLLEGKDAAELQRAILDYARTRVVSTEEWSTQAGAMAIIERSLKAQSRLWPLTWRIVGSKQPGPIEALLAASVNEVIDEHTVGLAVTIDRLPPPVFWMLVFVAAAAVSVAGFNAGLGGFMSRWRMSAMTVVLAAVMLVIIDFDRPNRGFIRVSQEPLKWAIADMEGTAVAERGE